MNAITGTSAVRTGRQIGRPLKVLIPLIQSELQQGNAAGRDHYRRAGELLIEAKDAVGFGSWGRWLTKNFDLSQQTARRYMEWARLAQNAHGEREVPYTSLREMTGQTDRDREHRQSAQHQAFKRVLRDVYRDEFVQERQTRDAEIQAHRNLAIKLIDAGFHALAKELHPDHRGGSKEAMARLNVIRDQLKEIARTRRFV